MLIYRVKIEGISPLLMHRFSDKKQGEVEGGTSASIPMGDREKDAEEAAYRLPDKDGKGELYTPAEHIERAMFHAAKYFKIGKKSAAGIVPASIFVQERAISHHRTDYIVDSRSVVIPATKGRVVRHRPRLDQWNLSFHLEVDETILKQELVSDILATAGKKIGIGDFRPTKGGSFGRFIVTEFKKEK
jgi:hypothetical protein